MKAYIAEAIGTFFLVLVIAFSGGNPVAIALVLASFIYAVGHISGGHFNPAVTLAVFLRGGLTGVSIGKYFLAQTAGAVLAALVFRGVDGSAFLPYTQNASGSLFLVEFLFTAALCFTVLSVATSTQTKGNQYFGLAIAGVLAAGILSGAAISGAVYNPAVALGTAIADYSKFGTHLPNVLLYNSAHFIGAFAAVMGFSMVQKEK